MENFITKAFHGVHQLKDIVDEIRIELDGKPSSRAVFDAVKSFYDHYARLPEEIGEENIYEFSELAKNVTVYAQLLGQSLKKSYSDSPINRELGEDLLRNAKSYRNFIENTIIENENFSLPPVSILQDEDIDSDLLFKKLRKSSEELDKRSNIVKSLIEKTERKIEGLSSQVLVLEGDVKTELEKISDLYVEKLELLKSKENQINEILGHVSGRAIAGDYEKSAESEMGMADWLRYSSLGIMVLIVIVVGYSFWETTTTNFEWQNSLFRMILALMLSVPAAYLARESTKHRLQHYNHLQTSLDLKAITPYIASLPEEEQHKIKVEVAKKLFANREQVSSLDNSYPVGTHEVIIELLKKIDFKGSKPEK
ncbi:hypothetical protein [Thiomicrorhabdus sp.]|uniref:hypothetical protein n=1 Tax=Thiomicrorhabdus sp. TaxID=2039724 RepID=UPI002AA73522|nr:hypothetical protein [Thiomicrorhabdus sp.]